MSCSSLGYIAQERLKHLIVTQTNDCLTVFDDAAQKLPWGVEET